jgi:hypothetical protein
MDKVEEKIEYGGKYLVIVEQITSTNGTRNFGINRTKHDYKRNKNTSKVEQNTSTTGKQK